MKNLKLEETNCDRKLVYFQPKQYEVNFRNVEDLLDVIEVLKELGITVSEDHHYNSENKYLFKEIKKC